MNIEDSYEVYFDMIRNIPLLTAEEEVKLAKRIQAGDKDAYERFVNANLRLVIKITKSFSCNVPRMDLIQEGNIGLMEAVKKYNPDLGHRFSTIGGRVITQRICKKIYDYDGMIRFPEDKMKELRGIEKAIKEFTAEFMRKPSDEELAAKLGKSVSYVKENRMYMSLTKSGSLDVSVGDDDDETTLGDMIGKEDKIEEDEDKQVIDLVKSVTQNVVKKAVKLFFEVQVQNEEDTKAVFTKIGERLYITPERARQIVTSYLEYQKNREHASYVESGYEDIFATLQIESKSGIKTAHTTDKFYQVRNWVKTDSDDDFLKNWDIFYRTKDTVELVKKIACTDFYIYFIRYAVERYAEILPGITAEDIFAEIQSGKNTLKLDQLAACLENEIKRNYGKISNVKKLMVAKKISEKDFFNLAVSLHMDIEDVEEFLQKVLMRDKLDPFHKDEAILYIALKYAEGNKFKFIEKATKTYDKVAAKELFVSKGEFNTAIYKSKVELLLEWIDDQMVVFDADDEVMEKLETLFAHMKFLETKSDYRRTADRVFMELYDEFRKLTKDDRGRAIGPAKEEFQGSGWAEGEVTIQYDCTKGLEIPAGQVFFSKKSGEEYQVGEDVSCPISDTFEIIVQVECTEKTELQPASTKHLEIGYAEKGTEFETEIFYIDGARNKSMLKLNKSDGKVGKIKGNLVITCNATLCEPGVTVLPAGTIFTANGIGYALVEDVLVVPTVSVTVRGEKEAKIREIQSMKEQENYPQIIKIDNTKISYKKDSTREKDDKGKSKLTHKLTGELDKYLYFCASGNNVYKFDLDTSDKSGKLREKLLRIFQGTDIDFANRTRAIQNAKNNQRVVTREELLTMAFLTEMAREQFAPVEKINLDAEERLASRMQRINHIMDMCGFYGIYPVNPYDCMMLYISTFEQEPIYVYRNLWGNLQDYVANKEN